MPSIPAMKKSIDDPMEEQPLKSDRQRLPTEPQDHSRASRRPPSVPKNPSTQHRNQPELQQYSKSNLYPPISPLAPKLDVAAPTHLAAHNGNHDASKPYRPALAKYAPTKNVPPARRDRDPRDLHDLRVVRNPPPLLPQQGRRPARPGLPPYEGLMRPDVPASSPSGEDLRMLQNRKNVAQPPILPKRAVRYKEPQYYYHQQQQQQAQNYPPNPYLSLVDQL